MPPAPKGERISYGPSRWPGGRGISGSAGEGLAGVRSVAGDQQRAAVGGAQDEVAIAAPDDADLADAAGHDPVAELEAQSGRGDDVVLDHAAAPGASGDREANGREAVAVEPPALDAIGEIAQDVDPVDQVLGRDEHAVPP